jgi:hypothetical protein
MDFAITTITYEDFFDSHTFILLIGEFMGVVSYLHGY